MSRVYRALEKAEEEKKRKGRQEAATKVFEEKAALKRETPILKFDEEKVERLELPPQEETPVLIIPPHSFAGEQFRKLKAQIFHRLPSPPHSILVTSTTPSEGKTMVAVNLALAISKEIHRKAVLIDADMRKPSIHLDKSGDRKGLANYLSDGIPLSEVLIKSEVENLQIITAGPPPRKSAELVGSKRMGELMKSLKEIGDSTYIIIDSPPVFSTVEPVLLSKMVDGVIFVVMAGRTPKEAISRAIKNLDREKIIGVVFNQIDLKPSSYYSKYYHRYYRKY
ncbi:MAG TPA: CpsD/CapB family tyrosine-protein kinase [Thermodesulfobacteriota bacterium]|jgi:capsular exopolysaccharide synthesis family protein|nr:CpsD/CapB family tyrosine-protein kinase [Thermodesulfobacteriota bacterium]